MTENEAKKNIIAYASIEAENLPVGMGIAFDTAIKALEEVQQYRQIGTIEECREAVEKQKARKPNHKYIKYGKHKWKRDEYGKIDNFAWEYEFCNGVVCERCGESVCVHCNPDYDKLDDCEADTYSCPFCDKEVGYRQKYCDCGQKLDWRENDENTD